jgi:hypothetical protein
VVPVRRNRTRTEVRFANVNPAVSFSISATSICVTVSYVRRCCDLATFDSAPHRVIGGYEDDLVMPEYAVVYPDQHSLWEREVFDYFKLWCADKFTAVAELLIR